MNADGTCEISNFPDEIGVDPEGRPVFGADRFDTRCTWQIGRLLYSGTWELNIAAAPDGGDLLLYLNWSRNIARGTSCLSRSLGDPDQNDVWELCAQTR